MHTIKLKHFKCHLLNYKEKNLLWQLWIITNPIVFGPYDSEIDLTILPTAGYDMNIR